MVYKMAADQAPPTIAKTPKPEEVLKDSNQDTGKKNDLGDKAQAYGYIVTNQR